MIRKVISGIELEERLCACGCGKSFLVMSESKCLYASSIHDPKKAIYNVNPWKKRKKSERIEIKEMILVDDSQPSDAVILEQIKYDVTLGKDKGSS